MRFENYLHDRGLHRLSVKWVEWKLQKGDPKGRTAASPQQPLPFGPPIRIALTLDDEVVIQPALEKNRERLLFCLTQIPAWDGLLNTSHLESGEWLKVPDGRFQSGRYMILERIEGKDYPIYGLFAADGGAVELNDHVANVVKSSFDDIDEKMAANQARQRYRQAEIVAGGGFGDPNINAPQVIPINRTYEQQQWRDDTEAQIEEIARADYHFAYSHYQTTPKHPDAVGEMHPAGFIIRDRRHRPSDASAD